MHGTKSQTAMEFTLLIAALLFIFLPVFYFLGDYSLKSSSDIAGSEVNKIGQKLVDESREMYYMGLFSKEIVSLNIPESVIDMSTIIINNSGKLEYYLVISTSSASGRMNVTFSSEVPLVTYKPCYIDNQISSSCNPGVVDCYRCPFDNSNKFYGLKSFKLETVSWKNSYAVNITQAEGW